MPRFMQIMFLQHLVLLKNWVYKQRSKYVAAQKVSCVKFGDVKFK